MNKLEEKREMKNFILEQGLICPEGKKHKNCMNCDMLEECNDQCNEDWHREYAKDIDYGGYDNEEQFWEQIYG